MKMDVLFYSYNSINNGSMIKKIAYYENKPLSNQDISSLLSNNVNIVLYPNLHKYDNIDHLIGKYDACVILFESQPQYGHWCCIFKVSDNLVEFFNPYGGWPDDSLQHINMEFRKKTNQYYPKLSELMIKSNYNLSYNEYAFQSHSKNIKTCGRHCVVRLLNKHLSLDDYVDYLDRIANKFNFNYDQIVTILTM
jgi:hypothetical protein